MYQTFYNFTDQPFKLAPDASFFYSSPGHKRALSYLQYGITRAEGFVVITGDIGTGKTTLIQTLLDDLDKKDHIVATISSTHLNPEELVRMIAASFSLDFETGNKVTLLKSLEKYMVDAAWKGQHVLIVVDEAQNLPPESLEELRMLSNIQVAGASALQILLLGQPELSLIINAKRMMQLKQRVIASYHLSPMSRDETEHYISYRLTQVGWTSSPSFSATAFDGIYEYTGGVPRIINTFCDRLLLYGYLEDLRDFDSEHIAHVVNEIEQEALGPELSMNDTNDEMNSLVNSRFQVLENRVISLEGKLLFVRDFLKRLAKSKKVKS